MLLDELLDEPAPADGVLVSVELLEEPDPADGVLVSMLLPLDEPVLADGVLVSVELPVDEPYPLDGVLVSVLLELELLLEPLGAAIVPNKVASTPAPATGVPLVINGVQFCKQAPEQLLTPEVSLLFVYRVMPLASTRIFPNVGSFATFTTAGPPVTGTTAVEEVPAEGVPVRSVEPLAVEVLLDEPVPAEGVLVMSVEPLTVEVLLEEPVPAGAVLVISVEPPAVEVPVEEPVPLEGVPVRSVPLAVEVLLPELNPDEGVLVRSVEPPAVVVSDTPGVPAALLLAAFVGPQAASARTRIAERHSKRNRPIF